MARLILIGTSGKCGVGGSRELREPVKPCPCGRIIRENPDKVARCIMTPMSNPQKITLSILLTITCALALIVLHLATQAYLSWTRQPLGPVLDYATPWELPATWTASPGASQPSLTHVPTRSIVTETPASPFLSCTNLPTMTLLVIGTDARSDNQKCHGW